MHSTDHVVQSIMKDLTTFAAKLMLWELKQNVSDDEITKFCATENIPVYSLDEIKKRWLKKQYQEGINLYSTEAHTVLERGHQITCVTANDKETATVVTPEETVENSKVFSASANEEDTATVVTQGETGVNSKVTSVTVVGEKTPAVVSSKEKDVSSAVDFLTQVTANRVLVESFVTSSTSQNMNKVQSIAPLCFCRIPCIRLVSKPTSRWPNNPFFKCSTNTCKFWQTAKKSLLPSLDKHSDTYYMDLLAKDDDGLTQLVNVMDEMEKNDMTNQEHEADTNILCFSNEVNSIGENINEAAGEMVTEDQNIAEDDVATLNTDDTTADIFQSLKGIKLPQPVKRKGRPQGLGKTTFDWKHGSSKTKPNKMRRENGLKIPDSDVTKESELEWSVASQTKGSVNIYSVTKSELLCHLCDSAECAHIWTYDKPVVALKRLSQRDSHHEVPSKQQRVNVTVRRRKGFFHIDSDDEISTDVKPKLKRTTHEIDTVTLSSDSEPEQLMSPSKSQGKVECPVCIQFGKPKAGDANAHKCAQCKVPIHAFGCSVPRGEGEEGHGGNDLLCINCSKMPTSKTPAICPICRKNGGNGHTCSCHICTMIISSSPDNVVCYRCKRMCHGFTCSSLIEAAELEAGDNIKFICSACEHALRFGISLTAFQDILSQKMLSDEHVHRASAMLHVQFGSTIDGLSSPLSVTYGEKVEKVTYYPRRTMDKHYVQIMHTGQSYHWVTAIFRKGILTVTILDSLRSTHLSGHTKMQCAIIAHTNDSSLVIVRPQCAQQKNSVDCALYSIAQTVEFCHEGKIQYIDFDSSQLRSRWKKCIEDGEIKVFPRKSTRAKKVIEQDDTCVVKIYCSSRLVDSFDDMVCCDTCTMWYHKICVELSGDPDFWICRNCLM
ncbi:Death-inducer obliterator 1 [Frankliniella fusca]|uniref:Death-inducer obliterator 1 n=1 Tax=Frankliniella fusca TaxID=407009 RepID=A0AAE1HR78_9NEOP|nr:Death-inducer obliterator 1 [Frankliniella fusca]